jgi:hypothetical protein
MILIGGVTGALGILGGSLKELMARKRIKLCSRPGLRTRQEDWLRQMAEREVPLVDRSEIATGGMSRAEAARMNAEAAIVFGPIAENVQATEGKRMGNAEGTGEDVGVGSAHEEGPMDTSEQVRKGGSVDDGSRGAG